MDGGHKKGLIFDRRSLMLDQVCLRIGEGRAVQTGAAPPWRTTPKPILFDNKR
ncbi:hypothetical protein BN2364_1251 [Alloalcanivorax xenomutans]|nr:hypothetical protein BN2364_1251 [Alloalcanivorax xenomutans]